MSVTRLLTLLLAHGPKNSVVPSLDHGLCFQTVPQGDLRVPLSRGREAGGLPGGSALLHLVTHALLHLVKPFLYLFSTGAFSIGF